MKRDPAFVWLKANGHDIAPLTGQDSRALLAIARCWELYAVSDENGMHAALAAASLLLRAMQPKCRPLARELIPFAMDWSDRDRVWSLVTMGGEGRE